MPKTHPTPAVDDLFISRPPYLLIGQIVRVEATADPPQIVYDLLDESGDSLCGPVREPLGARWWANFQPLVRRDG